MRPAVEGAAQIRGIMHLTYQNLNDTKGDVANVEPPEIEITPAMLAAGAEELARGYLGDNVYDLGEGRLENIYRAMYRLRP